MKKQNDQAYSSQDPKSI